MTANKFIRKLPRLKDLSVVNFEFGFKKRQLHLWVKPYKNGCRCPESQRCGRIMRTMEGLGFLVEKWGRGRMKERFTAQFISMGFRFERHG